MRLILTTILILTVLLPSAANAQSPPPNPLFRSIAGPVAEPSIFDAVSLSNHELLTLSVQFQKDQDKQKVLFAPFKLKEGYLPFWSEMILNFAQEGGNSTFGIGLGWTNAAPGGRRAQAILEGMFFPAEPPPLLNETKEQEAERRRVHFDRVLVPLYNTFYRSLAANSYQVTFGANVQTFQILAGDEVDIDEDGKIDNDYTLKGADLSAGILYTWSQATGMNATYHFSRKRASAVSGQALANYHGFSVSTGRRVAVLNPDYERSEAYLKNLFIPSVVVGGALELQHCTADVIGECDKGVRRQVAVTPYVDFKISPQAQFRISLPLRRLTQAGKKSGSELSPFVQFAIQLAGGR